MVTWQSDIPAAWIMVATPIFAERSVFVTTPYGRGCGLVQPARSELRHPAFVAKGIRRWLVQAGVSTLFIAKSSPWENGYVESFNGKFRDELLNGELFLGLEDARWVIDRWRIDYNHRRPHSALGYQTPAAFAANCVLEDSATLHPPEHRTTTDAKLSHSEWYKIWG